MLVMYPYTHTSLLQVNILHTSWVAPRMSIDNITIALPDAGGQDRPAGRTIVSAADPSPRWRGPERPCTF